MRILTKEQLLKDPSETVYAEYASEFIKENLHVKVGNNCNLDLVPAYEYGTKKDIHRQTNWSTDDLNIVADYDKNQLFAVFNKSEIMKMINCLS